MNIHTTMFLERFMTKTWANRFSWACAVLVAIIGCSETAYWAWHARGGANVIPFLSAMSANTSVTFILCGLALAMLHWEGWLPKVIRWGCAIVIMAVGFWTLLEYFNHPPFLIDQWIFSGFPVGSPFAVRMSLNSAAAFFIAGTLLIYTDAFKTRNGNVVQVLAWVIVGLAGIPLVGYLYGAESIYTFWQSKAMAPLTGFTFIFFSISIFMHFPGKGLLAAFSDLGMSGRMIRLTLPMALIIPILVEWCETVGENAGWYSSEFGSAMMAVTTSGLLIVVVFLNAKSLRQLDVERDIALQRVALSEKRLQAILDNTPALIYIKDSKGRFILVNRKYGAVFNVRTQDMVGKTIYDMFPPEQATVFAQNDKVVLRQGEAGEFEEMLTHPDGTLHTYLSAKFPLWDPMSNEKLVCGVSIDITDRKEEEARAHDLAKFKSEFASIVSHELRSPLTLIRGEVELVDDGTMGSVTPEQKKHLDIAIHSVDRLNRLITDVLDFQKLESGQMGFVPEPNNVAAIAGDCVGGFRTVAAGKGLELRVDLPSTLPLVLCDKDALVEVLTNLIDNAIKYTDSGYVEVHAREKNGYVEVGVTDSGVGIPQEDQNKLFHTFSRVRTKGRKAEGTGLGLVICKKIVENHGGTIGMTSQPGKGSTFLFTLPVAPKLSQKGTA